MWGLVVSFHVSARLSGVAGWTGDEVLELLVGVDPGANCLPAQRCSVERVSTAEPLSHTRERSEGLEASLVPQRRP